MPIHRIFERILTTKEKQEDLAGQIFAKCELRGVDLSGADLRNTLFEHVRIIECNLSRADLRGARLILCEVAHVVLTDALLGDNHFDGTSFVEIEGLTKEGRSTVVECGGSFQQAQASLR